MVKLDKEKVESLAMKPGERYFSPLSILLSMYSFISTAVHGMVVPLKAISMIKQLTTDEDLQYKYTLLFENAIMKMSKAKPEQKKYVYSDLVYGTLAPLLINKFGLDYDKIELIVNDFTSGGKYDSKSFALILEKRTRAPVREN